MGTPTYRILFACLLSSSIGLVGTAACCDEPELRVGDIQAMGDFSLSVSVGVEFSVEHAIVFDGDLPAWSGLAAAGNADVEYEFSSKHAYARELELDIDDDGVREKVEYLGFSNGSPANIERGFASWHGDRYSFDTGYCHLLSWQGAFGLLLSGHCGSTGAAVACPVGLERSTEPICQVCDATDACSVCSSQTLTECLREAKVSVAGGDIDAATATATAIATATATATTGAGVTVGIGGAAGAGSVSVDFDSCVAEVQRLADVGRQCGLPDGLDSSSLCREQLSDVNICFLAVEGAGIFGSVCAVAASASCEGVFR